MRNYISGVELLERGNDCLKFRVVKMGLCFDVSMIYLEGFDNCDVCTKKVTVGEGSVTKMFKIKDFVVKTTLSTKEEDFDDLYSYGEFLQQVEIYDLEYHVALFDSINCVYGQDTDSPVFGAVIAYCKSVLNVVYVMDDVDAEGLYEDDYFSHISYKKEAAHEYKGEITLIDQHCVRCDPSFHNYCVGCPYNKPREKITNISALHFYEYKDSDGVYKVSCEQAVNGERVTIKANSRNQFAADLLYEFALWYSSIK